MPRYDFVVIGGGLGGYPAAIELARRGHSVALVEARRLGGECANYGCIPTKALARAARILAEGSSTPGLSCRLESFAKLMAWVDEIRGRISEGIETLLEGYGVKIYWGRGRLRPPGDEVEVSSRGEIVVLEAERAVLVATGSEPSFPKGLEPDGTRVLDSRGLLELRDLPESVAVIGGGAVGVELASILASLGSRVTLIEAAPRLLPGVDADVASYLAKALSKRGINVRLSSPTIGLERSKDSVEVILEGGERARADVAVVATGRAPSSRGIGLEECGVELDERGFVKVSSTMRTSNPKIYAVGDVVGHPMLAHKAYAQSIVAARNMCGETVEFSKSVPFVVFSIPEVASVGASEGRSVIFRFGSLGRAIVESGGEGFLKLVYDPLTLRLTGAHAIGPGAGEIIYAASLAIDSGLDLNSVADSVAPHPTMVEALREAGQLALGRPIHFLLRGRRRGI
ncbi:MAG: NAD(P)/FAD-dependent oxidoreductase [Fervidicoccaceae archaeon]